MAVRTLHENEQMHETPQKHRYRSMSERNDGAINFYSVFGFWFK